MSGDDGLVVPKQRGDWKKEPSVLPDGLRGGDGWIWFGVGGRVCL